MRNVSRRVDGVDDPAEKAVVGGFIAFRHEHAIIQLKRATGRVLKPRITLRVVTGEVQGGIFIVEEEVGLGLWGRGSEGLDRGRRG